MSHRSQATTLTQVSPRQNSPWRLGLQFAAPVLIMLGVGCSPGGSKRSTLVCITSDNRQLGIVEKGYLSETFIFRNAGPRTVNLVQPPRVCGFDDVQLSTMSVQPGCSLRVDIRMLAVRTTRLTLTLRSVTGESVASISVAFSIHDNQEPELALRPSITDLGVVGPRSAMEVPLEIFAPGIDEAGGVVIESPLDGPLFRAHEDPDRWLLELKGFAPELAGHFVYPVHVRLEGLGTVSVLVLGEVGDSDH